MGTGLVLPDRSRCSSPFRFDLAEHRDQLVLDVGHETSAELCRQPQPRSETRTGWPSATTKYEAVIAGHVDPVDAPVEGQRVCRFWTARAVFDQPDWTRPYQQYTDTPGGTCWCTAVADAGDHEPFAVAVGTRTSTSSCSGAEAPPTARHRQCPDPRCCAPPPSQLANRWSATIWPSAGVHSAVLASLRAGAFPGVDQTEVLKIH
jgi:hypothetical protein